MLMAPHTQVSGKTINLMVMGSGVHHLHRSKAILANGRLGSAMALGSTSLQMVTCMRVTGKMVHSTTVVNTLMRMGTNSVGSGREVSRLTDHSISEMAASV